MDFLLEPLEPGSDLDPFQGDPTERISCANGYVCVAGAGESDFDPDIDI